MPHTEPCDRDLTDYDKDGVVDSKDNCFNEPNPKQEDSDGDGTGFDSDGGDACDPDVTPRVALAPALAPTDEGDQTDSDGDGILIPLTIVRP